MDIMLGLRVNLKLVSLFSVIYVVGVHWNCLIEAIPMFTFHICLSNNLVFHHKLFFRKSHLLSLFH